MHFDSVYTKSRPESLFHVSTIPAVMSTLPPTSSLKISGRVVLGSVSLSCSHARYSSQNFSWPSASIFARASASASFLIALSSSLVASAGVALLRNRVSSPLRSSTALSMSGDARGELIATSYGYSGSILECSSLNLDLPRHMT